MVVVELKVVALKVEALSMEALAMEVLEVEVYGMDEFEVALGVQSLEVLEMAEMAAVEIN